MPKTKEDSWPLGTYLRDQRGKMSIREAARRADISESRWRQVEAGFQRMAGGIEVPVHPRAETVVAMCKAISAEPRRGLELAGHNPTQYEWLLGTGEGMADEESREWFTSLPRDEREQVLAELQKLHLDTELGRQTTRRTRRGA